MSRRLVAGLVALIAIGGVFAYGLSKQDDVSSIDTKHVTVPPVGLPDVRRPRRSRARRSTASAFTLASPARQAGLHQLLGQLVPGLQERGARSARVRERPRRAGGDGRRGHRLAARRRAPAFVRKAGWRYPDRQQGLLRPRQPLRRDLLPDDGRRQQQGAGRRPPRRPADRRPAAEPSCARSAPECPSSPRSPSRRSDSAQPSPRASSRSSRPASGRSCRPTCRTSPACRSPISATRRGASRSPPPGSCSASARLHGARRGRGRDRRPAAGAPAHARDRLGSADHPHGRPAGRARRDGCCSRERRLQVGRKPAGPVGAVVAGAAFGIGWTPCVGPTLAAILALAGRSGHALDGAILLAVYSLGLGVPFLLSGLLFTRGLSSLAPLRRHGPAARARLGRRADGVRRAARAGPDDRAHERPRERIPGARVARTAWARPETPGTPAGEQSESAQTPRRMTRAARPQAYSASPPGQPTQRATSPTDTRTLPCGPRRSRPSHGESLGVAERSHILSQSGQEHAARGARRRAPRPGAGGRRQDQAIRPGAAARARRDAAAAPDPARALEVDARAAVLEAALDPATADARRAPAGAGAWPRRGPRTGRAPTRRAPRTRTCSA